MLAAIHVRERPRFAVAIDARSVLSAPVSAFSGYADYVVNVAVQPGTHNVQASFVNDYLGACDRNLYIDSLTLDSGTASPAPAAAWWRSSFENGSTTPSEWSVWVQPPCTVSGDLVSPMPS